MSKPPVVVKASMSAIFVLVGIQIMKPLFNGQQTVFFPKRLKYHQLQLILAKMNTIVDKTGQSTVQSSWRLGRRFTNYSS